MSKLLSKTNYIIVENCPDKIQVWKINKEQKLQNSYALCALHFCSMRYICLFKKFQVSSLNTYWVMLRTKFKNENEQRAITPKAWSFELWFLCTALLHNKIYLPMKFHVNALHRFKVMLRTKFKYENQQRAITLKVWCLDYGSWALHFTSIRSKCLWNFKSVAWILF